MTSKKTKNSKNHPSEKDDLKRLIENYKILNIGKAKQKIVKQNDEIWSLIVRIRDQFRCRMCGKVSKYVEAAHIIGRSNWATRWDTRNGISLCYYCHRFKIHGGGMTEEERIEFYKSVLSEETYNELLRLSKQPVKRNLAYAEYYNKLLRAEFQKLTGLTFEEYKKEVKLK
jgi:hypothetical protein